MSIFFSCATTVRTTIERPAELDLNGAEELSIIPFQTSAGDFEKGIDITVSVIDLFASIATGHNITHGKLTDQVEIADYLTREIESSFSQSNYMKLVPSSAVQSAITSGTAIPCDVYLTGNISNFKNDINKTYDFEYVEVKVFEDGEIVRKKEKRKVLKFYREVSFDVYYKIIDADTNRITSVQTEHVHKTSSNADKSYQVESALECVKYQLQSISSQILRQIQPYYVTKTYTLLKDKTKNEQMKTANQLAKKGLLKESQKLFESLYNEFRYPEALYNSAIVLVTLHEYEKARDQLNTLISISPSSDAYAALDDVQKEINQRERLKQQKNLKGKRNSGAKKNSEKQNQNSKPVKQEKPVTPQKSGIFSSDYDDDIEDL